MSWLRNVFTCWGARKQGGRGSSAAQHRSKANQDPDVLSDFTGEMPPFEKKDKTVSIKYHSS